MPTSAASAAAKASTINFPMPFGTGWDAWNAALDDACVRIAAFAPDVVVVSLGVDTFEKDPISQFKLTSADYPKIGAGSPGSACRRSSSWKAAMRSKRSASTPSAC